MRKPPAKFYRLLESCRRLAVVCAVNQLSSAISFSSNKTCLNLIEGKGKKVIPPPLTCSTPRLLNTTNRAEFCRPEPGGRCLREQTRRYMFQDEASPMLRETTDAARKNDAPYLCWQKMWRMLAGGNHTAKSKYLNMESTIAYNTFRSSFEFAQEYPDASFVQVPRFR